MSEELEAQDREMEALPKLPLPNIRRTLDRYLNAVEAIVTNEQLTEVKNDVVKFVENTKLLEEIDGLLTTRNKDKDNWAYEYWLDDMYMQNPVSLPINSNPGWVFPQRTFRTKDDFCIYLAQLSHGLLMHKQRIERAPLAPETLTSRDGNKQPLCMEQYYRVFTTYRQPGLKADMQIINNGRTSRDKETIIVMMHARIFEIIVKMKNDWIDIKHLTKLFSTIEANTIDDLPLDERVSMMTSMPRAHWARLRQTLSLDPFNVDTLNAIESCLFIVCMDKLQQNRTDLARSQKSMLRQMLDGQGPFVNGSNRWFDKTIQIVCSMDGVSGLCYEHSVAEGIAVVAIVQDVLSNLKDNATFDLVEDTKFTAKELTFKLTDELRRGISSATLAFRSLSNDVDMEVFVFDDFGKNFMKTCKCSPDAFAQMTLQLAYFRLHGHLCFTYESASTRRFRHGRVDNIRSSHPEALAWVQAMMANVERDIRLSFFKAAVEKQTTIMVENITGYGLDIPLLGIREACKTARPDEKIDLFENEVYSKSNLFKLSTSQVPISLPNSYMGYGAVVPDGYGVSYNLQDDNIIFCIGSFFSAMHTGSIKMADSIDWSLKAIKELLSN